MQQLFGTAFETAGVLLPWVLSQLPLALGIGVMTPYLMAQNQERPLAWLMALAGALLTAAAPSPRRPRSPLAKSPTTA